MFLVSIHLGYDFQCGIPQHSSWLELLFISQHNTQVTIWKLKFSWKKKKNGFQITKKTLVVIVWLGWPVSSYNLQIWIFWIFVEPLQEVIFSILNNRLSAPFENFQPIFGFIDIMWDVSVSKITYWKSRMEIEYLVWMFIDIEKSCFYIFFIYFFVLLMFFTDQSLMLEKTWKS